jgi:hypothetical protein
MRNLLLTFSLLLMFNARAEDPNPSTEVVDPMAPLPEVSNSEAQPEKVEPPVEEATTAQTTPKQEEISPPIALPAPVSKIEVEDEDGFNPRKSHWITNFGFEAMEYEVPMNFAGSKKNFQDQKRQLYGGRLGFGRELYLGWGFNTTTRIEGFYMGTLFESARDVDTDAVASDTSSVKKTGNIWGGEVSQSLGFLFDMKTRNPFMDEMTYLSVEPYVFAGIGRATAYNRLNYHYDNTISEDYRIKVQDNINTASVGAGINFTSMTGFFLYLKATQYRFNITKRKETGYSQPDGQAGSDINSTSNDVSPNPVTVYALGGGYKF